MWNFREHCFRIIQMMGSILTACVTARTAKRTANISLQTDVSMITVWLGHRRNKLKVLSCALDRTQKLLKSDFIVEVSCQTICRNVCFMFFYNKQNKVRCLVAVESGLTASTRPASLLFPLSTRVNCEPWLRYLCPLLLTSFVLTLIPVPTPVSRNKRRRSD